MGSFFTMGGYAGFVWPCYVLTLGGMAWLALSSWRRARNAAARLEDMSPKKEDRAG